MRYLPYLILFFALVLPSLALASEDAGACYPKCRDGYLCHEGQCVSRCNPGCGADEVCSNEGICVLNAASSGTAYEPHKLFSFSAKAGLVFPAEIWIDHEVSFDTETSYGFGADFNYIVIPRLSLGIYLTVGNIVPENSDYTATFISIGGSIRPRFSLGKVDFRPGFLIGSNQFSSDYKYADGVYGMNIGFSGLFAIPMESFEIILEPGFYSQPVGGNSDFEVTFVPSWYFLAGVEL